jgi:ribosomal protein L37E
MSEYVQYCRAKRYNDCPECGSGAYHVARLQASCTDCGFRYDF